MKRLFISPATALGLIAALLLFLLFQFQALKGWSANSDHPALGYDYFGWPRAALAIRNGTDPFTADVDYKYGPYATKFVSFPTLAVLGVPLTYLSPWTGFWIVNTLALILHLAIILVFGERAAADGARSPRNIVFMLAMGFYLPWYVMYHMGQYHSLAVLAVFLVLASENRAAQVAGFMISALAKPVLGPAATVLFLRREWKTIWIVMGLIFLTMAPWFVLRHDASGLHFAHNPIMKEYIDEARLISRYTAHRWNQEISLAAALGEFMPPARNLELREIFSVFMIAIAAVMAVNRDRRVAISMALMWFFVFYARGHEYHYTLLVPVMLCLWSLPGGRYRTWWMVALAIAAAAPTTWIIFKYYYKFPNPQIGSCELMLSTNRSLYYAFLWHKPVAALLLAATIAWTETFKSRIRNERPFSP